jgi:uncharacterized protein
MSTSSTPFAGFDRHRYVSLTSYRKNGEGVATPVWLLPHEGKLFIWTNRESFKAKRLARDPRCTVAPCNANGKQLLGPHLDGHARFVEPIRASEIASMMKARYGIQFALIRALNWLRGIREYAVIEISPS